MNVLVPAAFRHGMTAGITSSIADALQESGQRPLDLPAPRDLTHARGHNTFAGRLDEQDVSGLWGGGFAGSGRCLR